MSAVGRDDCIVLLSGPSGAGKTSLANSLQEHSPSIARVVSYTTRRPRLGEREGHDYHFVTEHDFQEFHAASDLILDLTQVNMSRYWVTIDSVERVLSRGKIPLLVVDPIGGLRISSNHDCIAFFLFGSDSAELRSRMALRGDPAIDVEARSAIYDEEISHAADYEHIIRSDKSHEQLDFVRRVLDREFDGRLKWIQS